LTHITFNQVPKVFFQWVGFSTETTTHQAQIIMLIPMTLKTLILPFKIPFLLQAVPARKIQKTAGL
jgi:hypothetical protein